MNNFVVGEKYPQFKLTDGAQMKIDENGITVFITMSKMTKEEEKVSREGDFTYYLSVYNKLLVFIIDYGDFSFDMGFNRERMKTPLQKIDIEDDKSGYSMTIISADGETGELKSIRLIGLSNRFSKKLYKALEEQEPFSSLEEEMQVIRAIQSEKTIKEIISQSIAYGKSSRS